MPLLLIHPVGTSIITWIREYALTSDASSRNIYYYLETIETPSRIAFPAIMAPAAVWYIGRGEYSTSSSRICGGKKCILHHKIKICSEYQNSLSVPICLYDSLSSLCVSMIPCQLCVSMISCPLCVSMIPCPLCVSMIPFPLSVSL